MPVPVIVDAVRTPYGKRGGALSGVHAVELLGGIQTRLLERTGVDPASVTEVIGGCVTQAGEQSNNVTRFAWLHAGWTEWKNIFSFEVMLERAKLEVEGLGGSYGQERLTLHEMQPEMGPPPATTWAYPPADVSWRAEMADVLAAIDGAPAVGALIDDAIANLSLIEKAYGA